LENIKINNIIELYLKIEGFYMNKAKIKNNQEVSLREATKDDAKSIIDFYNIVGGETTYLSFGEDEYKVTIEQ
jgi:hypothetical protein